MKITKIEKLLNIKPNTGDIDEEMEEILREALTNANNLGEVKLTFKTFQQLYDLLDKTKKNNKKIIQNTKILLQILLKKRCPPPPCNMYIMYIHIYNFYRTEHSPPFFGKILYIHIYIIYTNNYW